MHERFVGSLTTAGVGDGPTETCLHLYFEQNIGGCRAASTKKKSVFAKKWPKIATFLPKDFPNGL